MKELFKPFMHLAESIGEIMNPKYDYLVINKKTGTHEYHTWSGVVDLINNEGINNFIVFNANDEIQLSNEIRILKEEVKEDKK